MTVLFVASPMIANVQPKLGILHTLLLLGKCTVPSKTPYSNKSEEESPTDKQPNTLISFLKT